MSFAQADFDIDEPQEEEVESSGPSTLRRLLPWLFVLGLLLLFPPLYLLSAAIESALPEMETELSTIQTQLQATPVPDAGEEELRDAVFNLRTLNANLENLRTNLTSQSVNWPAVMAVVANYDRSRMALTDLVQIETRLVLEGHADEEIVITAYADMLREDPLFALVTIQSISRVELVDQVSRAEFVIAADLEIQP